MKSPALALAAIAAAGCAASLSPQGMEPATSLAAAETAFAAHSMREDMRVAFLANFADDGVLVRNGWIVSNTYLSGRPAPPIALDWRPQYVEAASSGDLGLSTGPSKITSKAKPDTPPTYGQFVSIWRRVGTGPWKVEVDLGINHDDPVLWDRPLETRVVQGAGTPPAGGLDAAEQRFRSAAARDGARAAYRAHGADNLRFYRGGMAPAIGRDAALASPAMNDERLAYSIERAETARSGDFGYARGSYAAAAAPEKTLGYFMRAWRLEGGEWKVVMDVTNPVRN